MGTEYRGKESEAWSSTHTPPNAEVKNEWATPHLQRVHKDFTNHENFHYRIFLHPTSYAAASCRLLFCPNACLQQLFSSALSPLPSLRTTGDNRTGKWQLCAAFRHNIWASWQSILRIALTLIYSELFNIIDRLCGLVVRVSGYRYRGLGFDSRRYQIFWVVVGLERGPRSLVRSTEELLE